MMKNIIVGTSTVVVLLLAIYTFQEGPAFQGGPSVKVFGDFADMNKNPIASKGIDAKSDREKESDKLQALRDKAGSLVSFKVSHAYKSRCSSCHGADGSGMQGNKKLMGPKLIGKSEDDIYRSLVDFKTGKVENTIMRGLLLSLSDDDLKEFSKEIGEFQGRVDANK